jgi:diguanylate cyclase (GGDEF)-like protein
MTTQTISPALLEKLLVIYQDQLKERPPSPQEPFLNVLEEMKNFPVAQEFQELQCQPGDIIISENDQGDKFYLIRSGRTAVLKGDLKSPVVLAFREAGDIIGEMALLGGGVRSATIVALDSMTLWVIKRELFHRFLSENPSFSIEVMGVLSQRLRKSDEERTLRLVKEIEYEETIDDLRQQTYRDALTGVFNRRYLNERLEREINHARQAGSTIGILMLDVDHFKRVNDTYSHKAGDLVLQALGALLKGSTRSEDFVCRYGGEEFVVSMPGVFLATCCERAEQIRTRFQELTVPFEDQEIKATLSLGIAVFPIHGSGAEEVLMHADQALYQAKRRGRNRVIVWSPEMSDTPGSS